MAAMNQLLSHVYRRGAGKHGCWHWRGEVNFQGAASFREYVNGKRTRFMAARLLWEKIYGVIPDGLVLSSKCRDLRCVRPNHQQLITQREAINRAVAAGRMSVGKLNPNYKNGHWTERRSSRLTGKKYVPMTWWRPSRRAYR